MKDPASTVSPVATPADDEPGSKMTAGKQKWIKILDHGVLQ